MKIIENITEMQKISEEFRSKGKSIAVVPTMGYLHKGHLSLIEKANELADIVITTLFVNPSQFAAGEDFESYPRDFEKDAEKAKSADTDYLFCPTVNEMYPDNYSTEISVSGVTSKFEGLTRPDHFNGVATVVAKLFNVTLPHYAVFGQKDYQQTLLIRKLTRDLNLNIKIIVSPTVREADGLAMSSRNTYLSTELRTKASVLFRALEEAKIAIENGERDRKIINATMHKVLRGVPDIRIDYASAADADNLQEPERFDPLQLIVLLIAVYLDKIRLIDNALVTIPSVFPKLETK